MMYAGKQLNVKYRNVLLHGDVVIDYIGRFAEENPLAPLRGAVPFNKGDEGEVLLHRVVSFSKRDG